MLNKCLPLRHGGAISYIIVSFLFSALPLNAQNTLTGKITDAAGAPLAGATVFLPDLKTGAAADESGYYALHNLPARSLLVEVSYVGYDKNIGMITIAGKTTHDFQLQESHTETREVVVTGLSAASEKRLASTPVDILKKDYFFQHTAANLIDQLAQTPGIGSISTGAGISKPVIRGLGYNRVLTVQDGIRQEGQQWGDEHGIEVDEFGVDRVEILKGPASLLFGSDGIAGVINLQSALPVEDGTALIQFQPQYQSNNGMTAFSGNVAANKNGWNGFARYSQKNAGEFRTPTDGKVFNSGFDEHNLSGMFGLNRSWGYVHLFASSFDQKVGLVEGERDSTGAFLTEAAPYQRITHRKISLNNSFILGGYSLKTVLGFQNNRRREFEEPDSPPGLYFDLSTLTYDVKLLFPDINGWERSIGVNGMHQVNRNKGFEALIPDYRQTDAGLFAFAKKSIGKTHFSAGIRGDLRSLHTELREEDGEVKFRAFDKTFRSVSASLGFVREVRDGLVFKLNLSKGFRSPNIAELSSKGVHEGTFRYEYGNAGLSPEDNFQVDLGGEFTNRHITLAVNVFNNYINHFIFIEKLVASGGGDSIPDPENSVPAYQFTQNRANLFGGEIALDVHPHPLDWLHIENSFSVVFARQLGDTRDYLPFIPAPKIQSELRGDWARAGKKVQNLYARIEAEYYFAQNRVLLANNFETPAHAYTLVGLGAGFEWRLSGRFAPQISLAVNNLLDEAYQSHLNRLRYAPENPATGQQGVLNPGRNFVIKMNLPLTLKLH